MRIISTAPTEREQRVLDACIAKTPGACEVLDRRAARAGAEGSVSRLPNPGIVLPDPKATLVYVVLHAGPFGDEYVLDAAEDLVAFQTRGFANAFAFALERRGVETVRVVERTLSELSLYVDAIGGPSRFRLFEAKTTSYADAGEKAQALGTEIATRILADHGE